MIGSPARFPVLPRRDLMKASVNLVRVVTLDDLNLKGIHWFTDSKYLDQGHLLLADMWSNRLVLLNENMKIMTEIKVNGEPSCVDVSDDGTEVTVVCDRNSVHYYSLSDGREVSRRMTVEQGACGVAVTCDTTIIGHTNKVALYDNKGNMIKSTISTTCPSIAVSNNGQQFFYCEEEDGTVVACDKQFNVIWRKQCDNLRGPCGICVDPSDNVYAVGPYSKNIHQISGDGTIHRVLLQQMNKMQKPWSIAFHRTRDMFMVTSVREDVAFEVYEFS